MKFLRIALVALYILSLLWPVPELLGRTSYTSQAVLGRYSPLYAGLLFIYLLVILLWIGAALAVPGFRPVSRLTARLLNRGEIVWVALIGLWLFHLAYLLEFAWWGLSQDAGAAILLGLPLSLLGMLAVAPPAAARAFLRGAPVAFGALALCVLGLELAVQAVFPFGVRQERFILSPGEDTPWRKYVGWAPTAGASLYYSSPGEFLMRIDINSHGLRDYEYAYTKPADTYRILVLGDSFTYGAEVELDQTWQQVLERRLNEVSDRRVEVIAGADSGWSTDQQLLYLRYEGCRYQPDMVLLQYSFNDPAGNNDTELPKPYFTLSGSGELSLNNFPYEESSSWTSAETSTSTSALNLVQPLVVWSPTIRITWQLLQQTARDYAEAADRRRVVPYAPVDPVSAYEDLTLTEALLAELHREATRCGALMAGFSEPVMWHLAPDTAPERRDLLIQGIQRYLDMLERIGVPHPSYETIVAPFVQYMQEGGSNWDLTFRMAGHHTTLGYRMLGDMVADWLIENRLIPLR